MLSKNAAGQRYANMLRDVNPQGFVSTMRPKSVTGRTTGASTIGFLRTSAPFVFMEQTGLEWLFLKRTLRDGLCNELLMNSSSEVHNWLAVDNYHSNPFIVFVLPISRIRQFLMTAR
jgi:hypothetical protein